MLKRDIQHFFVNLLCGFVPSQTTRKKIRVTLNNNVIYYLKFIRKDCGEKIRKIRTFSGYGEHNLLISINDKWIYKISARKRNDIAIREKRIVDALSPISPIYIPDVTLLNYNGEIIRKYPFVSGCHIMALPTHIREQNETKIAKQVAKFIYALSAADPKEIQDLKPNANAKPGFMHGWCHCDIYGNFMLDKKTLRVTSFIDFEGTTFTNFANIFEPRNKREVHPGTYKFLAKVGQEYSKIYNEHHKK